MNRNDCLTNQPGHWLTTEEIGHGRVEWTCSCGNRWLTHTDED